MTTHDFTMLERYADMVVLIDHGVVAMGSPAQGLNSPQVRETFHMKGGLA